MPATGQSAKQDVIGPVRRRVVSSNVRLQAIKDAVVLGWDDVDRHQVPAACASDHQIGLPHSVVTLY
jgi:hypothetical protein